MVVVWKWAEGTWYAYSPDSFASDELTSQGIPTFSKIDAGEGFWINIQDVASAADESILATPPAPEGFE